MRAGSGARPGRRLVPDGRGAGGRPGCRARPSRRERPFMEGQTLARGARNGRYRPLYTQAPMAAPILDELAWRGLVAHTTDADALGSALAAAPITFYCGFDPTHE